MRTYVPEVTSGSSHQVREGKNALAILFTAIVLLVAYMLFLRLGDRHAVLSESNLQSNLGRVSAYLRSQKVDAVLVGSSVAGRLLSSYFDQSGMPVHNLGLDGSRPMFGFEVVGMRNDIPCTMLIDTSTLFIRSDKNDLALRDAICSPTMALGKWLPFLRPESRPSSLIYCSIKGLRDRTGGGILLDAKKRSGSHSANGGGAWVEDRYYIEVRDAISDCQKRGMRIALLSIPRGEGWGERCSGAERRLADELGVPLLEPGVTLAESKATLRFTDGVHLDVQSAKAVAEEIIREMCSLDYDTKNMCPPCGGSR